MRGAANMRSLMLGLSLGYTTSSQSSQQTVVLSVDDQESLERLVQIELTPEQFTELLSSRYLTVPGASTAAPWRLGLRRSNEERPLPHLPYSLSDAAKEREREAIAATEPSGEVFLRRTQRGWVATVFRWGQR